MARQSADLGALVEALLDGEVRFIVVGGAAAVLHGAPTTTLDLDILIERSSENAALLQRVLHRLDARVRDLTGRDLRPDPKLLEEVRQLRLSTNLGPLDVLGELHDGRGYEAIAPKSVRFRDGDRSIRVVDLPTLIEVKSSTAREKDRLILPLLLALLDERGAQGSTES